MPQSAVDNVFVKSFTRKCQSGHSVNIICPHLQHSVLGYKLPVEEMSAQKLLIHLESQDLGFCGHVATHKPKIIMCHGECGLKCCKACLFSRVITLHLAIWQSKGLI